MRKEITKLIELLVAQNRMTPEELASALEVSSRTMRSYVNQANEELQGFARIIKHRGTDYELIVDDKDQFDAFQKERHIAAQTAKPSSPAERVDFLISNLLQRNDWITLEELSEMLFVSKSALSTDIKLVEKEIAKFHLSILKRPYYGIKVEGSEVNRRICIANQVLKKLGAQGILEGNDFQLNRITSVVEQVIDADGYRINPAAHQNLIIHIAIALSRIANNCYVPLTEENLSSIKNNAGYATAQKIAHEIEQQFQVSLPEEEVAYIAIHLAGKQSLSEAGQEDSLVISDEAWSIVQQMIEVIWSAYRFDFRNDLELQMNLARHVVPLSVRLQYNMTVNNPLLKDIKTRFSLAYSMAIDACSVLSDYFKTTVSDDEIGFVALAFALALERRKTEVPKKNILVVCASGAGSARLLEWRVRDAFGPYINTIQLCDVTKIDRVDFADIDYVFSTVPINKALSVPIRQVSNFLDASDISSMQSVFHDEKLSADELSDFFSSDLFFSHLDFATKEDVIDYLCEQATQKLSLPKEFKASVYERENAAQTSFGNNVAMPHPMNAMSSKSAVVVGILDKSVDWNANAVQAVFLVCIAKDKDWRLQSFFRTFSHFLISDQAIQELIQNQTFEEFLSSLKNTQ